MKCKFIILLILFFQTFISNAQTIITLGTGTSISRSAGPIIIGNGSSPFYARQIAIYTKAEINTAGVTTGILQKIRWYRGDANNYNLSNSQFRIYIKHTTQTSLPNSNINWVNELSSASLVYTNNSQVILPAIGWQEFVLNTPFVWNGTDNLEILVDWYQPLGSTAQIYWQHSFIANMSGNAGAFNTAPATLNGSGSRPNIQLEFGSNIVIDAGITAITSPVSPVLPGVSLPVQATLRNFGGTGLTAATINWSVNGVLQTPYAWSGNLSPATSSAPLTIGNYSFPAGSHTLCAWTQNPNGNPDANPQNDSSCVTLASCAPLAGNYTINSGAAASATNFISFNAAVRRLTECGVNGPVKFTAAPGSGPYPEQVEITAIPGSKSAADSVVFEGNGVTIAATNTVARRAAILLNGARKVIFRNVNLQVGVTGLPDNYGFQLINRADSCTIANCTINLTGNTYSYGILAGSSVTAAGNFTSHSTFRNNTITGGHTAIRLQGDAATPGMGNRVLQNQVRNFYFNGIYLQHAVGALVESNEISRPALTAGGGFVGIYLDRGYQNNIINANRIHTTNSGGLATIATGIHLLNSDAPVGSENIIKNNLLYNFNTPDQKTGIYNLSSDGAHFFHNTVFLENTQPASGNTKGFYQDVAATNLKFINNIISLGMAGGYKHHALYFNTPASAIESHHNVLYLNPAATAPMFTGYANGSDFATLAQWQTASGGPYDLNSVAVNPAFANVATGNLKPTNTSLKNTGAPLTAVLTDFNGTPRNVTNPDPGAFEFSNPAGIAGNDQPILGLTAYPNPFTQVLNLQFYAPKAGELHLTLRDALGRTISQETSKIPAGPQLIAPDFDTNLPPGFYVLQIELDGLKTQQKLIKQ